MALVQCTINLCPFATFRGARRITKNCHTPPLHDIVVLSFQIWSISPKNYTGNGRRTGVLCVFLDSSISKPRDILRAAVPCEPTPIQQQRDSRRAEGRDPAASAQTGTGKTAGFTPAIVAAFGYPSAHASVVARCVRDPHANRELARR
ncbi:hypothetical protein KCP69_20410 [Salmonella enterica subsp. enterica]|nr:hypothetical protein KCP69_20410 [Salmonella enterica subsp. enterica]